MVCHNLENKISAWCSQMLFGNRLKITMYWIALLYSLINWFTRRGVSFVGVGGEALSGPFVKTVQNSKFL